MIPSTKDLNYTLTNTILSENFYYLPYEEKFEYLDTYLNKYLLFKLIHFNLNCYNYTIDNDFELIITSLDELIQTSNDKENFFDNIILCLLAFLSTIHEKNINWEVIDDINLLNNPNLTINENYGEYQTYEKENPASICLNLYSHIKKLKPNYKLQYSLLQ